MGDFIGGTNIWGDGESPQLGWVLSSTSKRSEGCFGKDRGKGKQLCVISNLLVLSLVLSILLSLSKLLSILRVFVYYYFVICMYIYIYSSYKIMITKKNKCKEKTVVLSAITIWLAMIIISIFFPYLSTLGLETIPRTQGLRQCWGRSQHVAGPAT